MNKISEFFEDHFWLGLTISLTTVLAIMMGLIVFTITIDADQKARLKEVDYEFYEKKAQLCIENGYCDDKNVNLTTGE